MERKEPNTFILMLLVSFATILAILFTPALPEIAKKLSLSDAEVQMTMTSYLIGYALGNLPYGPIANRIGRKATLRLGSSIAILGILLTLWSQSLNLFPLFLAGRFLTAFGATSGLKIGYTMVGDVYKGKEATKKLAFFSLSFAIASPLSMWLGGFLTEKWGWQSCFLAMLAYSLIVLASTLLLAETSKKRDPNALDLHQIALSFKRKFKNKRLILAALLMGCCSAQVYLFATNAPFIAIDHIGITPDHYGALTFVPYSGMVLSVYLIHRLADKYSHLRVISAGMALWIIASASMLLLFLAGVVTIWTLFLLVAVIYCGNSLIFSNSSSLALEHAQDKSTGAAVMSFINISLPIIFLSIEGELKIQEPYMLPAFLLFTSCVGVAIRGLLGRSISRQE